MTDARKAASAAQGDAGAGAQGNAAAAKPVAKVPRVVRDLQEATRRDIAPAVRLMGRIFVGTLLGGTDSFVRGVASAAGAASAATAASTESAGRGARKSASVAPGAPAGAIVVDAEILSEECGTCGGTHKVGRPGYEIACPKCRGK